MAGRIAGLVRFVDEYADNIAGATAWGWHVHHYDACEHDAFARRISVLLAG